MEIDIDIRASISLTLPEEMGKLEVESVVGNIKAEIESAINNFALEYDEYDPFVQDIDVSISEFD